jgi:hypothetical protein
MGKLLDSFDLTMLIHLDVSDNNIGDAGSLALAQGIQARRCTVQPCVVPSLYV